MPSMPNHISNNIQIHVGSSLCLLLSVFIHTVHSTLTVEPVHIAAEVGNDAVFVCKGDSTVTEPDKTLVWSFGECSQTNTNFISTIDNGTNRKTNIKGTFTVRKGELSDGGKYCCTLYQKSGTNGSTPVTPLQQQGAQLVIYNMSDYEAELITVGLVAGVLFLLMIVLIVVKHRSEVRRRKMDEKLTKIKAQKRELQQSQQGGATKEIEL